MTGWHERLRLLSFDTETTGVSVEQDRIVTAALVYCGGGEPVEIRRWLVAVDIDIPEAAQNVHGVSTEVARRDGIPAKAALEGILAELETWCDGTRPLIGFNVPFDLTILDREARRWLGEGLTFTPRPVVDPLVLDKQFSRYRRGKRTLGDLCRLYEVTLEDAHAAHGDALAAARLAWRLAQVFPDECADLDGLHDAQIGWYAAQSASFANYLRRCAAKTTNADEAAALNQRADTVDSEWPLRPYVGAEAAA